MNAIASYMSVQAGGDDELLIRHAPLVKRIAYHLVARLPSCVQVDDLIQAGMIGLLDAARHYDPAQGASFETYAGIRVRGAMLDEIRRNDWAPRSVHRKAREVSQAMRDIEAREGREARDQEVAAVLGIGLDEYHQILQDASSCRLFSLDESDDERPSLGDDIADTRPGPMQDLEGDDFRRALAEAIAALPQREQQVLSLYYNDELNLREIGAVLGVTESRVSQIHSQAVLRLRGRLGWWKQD